MQKLLLATSLAIFIVITAPVTPTLAGGGSGGSGVGLGGSLGATTPKPKITKSKTKKPKVTKSKAKKPKVTKPKAKPQTGLGGGLNATTPKPKAKKPKATKPKVTKPKATKPDLGGGLSVTTPKPKTKKPKTDKPKVTKPKVTKPKATKPDLGGGLSVTTPKPKTKKPKTDKPKATKPKATKPDLGGSLSVTTPKPKTKKKTDKPHIDLGGNVSATVQQPKGGKPKITKPQVKHADLGGNLDATTQPKPQPKSQVKQPDLGRFVSATVQHPTPHKPKGGKPGGRPWYAGRTWMLGLPPEKAAGPYAFIGADGWRLRWGAGAAHKTLPKGAHFDVASFYNEAFLFGTREEDNRRIGTRGSAQLFNGATPTEKWIGVERSDLLVGAEISAGEDGATVGVQGSTISGGLWAGDFSNQRKDDTQAHIAVGGGRGFGIRLHWSDQDKDGKREWGIGGDPGLMSLDIKSEDPLFFLKPFPKSRH